MRLLSLTALAALLLAAPASAQVAIGVKAGLNVATLSGDGTAGLDPRLGFAGGLQARFDLTPAVGLQVEALYSQKGAEDSEGIDDGTYQFDYIEIPVLARVALPVSRLADAGIYAGPSFGIPVGGRFDSAELDELDIDYDGDLATDIGVAVGADYYGGPVGIDLRYTFGVTDTFEDGVGLANARNGAFTVSLGYRFGGSAPSRGYGGRY